MRGERWPLLRTAHAASFLGGLAVLLCTGACATQGDDAAGRPAGLPGAGGPGGAAVTAEAGLGGAAGGGSASSGGAPATAEAGSEGGLDDAAAQPPGELPPECVFDEADLDEPVDPAAKTGSASLRAAGCLIGTVVGVCNSAAGFRYFCPEATVRDVVRCVRSILQFSPEMCVSTPVGIAPECAGAVSFCKPTGCVSSACPQEPPVPLPFVLSPCCTLTGECGFVGANSLGRPTCLAADTFPWSSRDAGGDSSGEERLP